MFELAFFWVFTLPTSLIAAICLYDLYRRQKKQSYVENGDLDLICQLAKFPYEKKNENHCLILMDKYQICPNAFNKTFPHSGMTPFLSSCYGGSLKLIQFMLEAGADHRAQNVNGDGALYIATYGIACRLQSVPCPKQRSIQVQLGVLIIDCLLKLGCDINLRNNFGFTPLHWAATTGEKWLVQHLLKRGADPSILTFFSRAPAAAFAPDKVQNLLGEAEKVHQSF